MSRPALFQTIEAACCGVGANCGWHFARSGEVGWALLAAAIVVSSAVQIGASLQRDGLFGWRRQRSGFPGE